MTGSPEESPAAPERVPPDTPPGGRTFSLEGRPAPGLYLVAWVLTGLGVAMLFVASLSNVPGARGLLLLGGLVLLTLGLSAAAGYQLVDRRRRPAEAYHGPSPLIVFGVWFGLVNVAALPLLLLGIQRVEESPGPFLLGVVVQTVAYVVPVWLFVVRSGALSWAQLGLPRRTDVTRVLRDAAFAAGVMLPVTLLALIGGGLVARLLDARPPTVVPTPENLGETVAVLLAAAILAPIGEELFFRGFALTAWWRDLGARAAWVRSSLFFALIHVVNVQAEPGPEPDGALSLALRQVAVILAVILPLGFVLGWLFIRRGLVAPIVAHITYNGILVALLVLATQLPPVPSQ